MKDYRKTVEQRYGQESPHPYDNKYSIINPVGFHALISYQKAFFKIINEIRSQGIDIANARILDIGSGNGFWTRFFSEMADTHANICGLELSGTRIAKAKEMNPNIRYVQGDLLDKRIIDQLGRSTWDVVTAMTVFMHLNSDQLEIAWNQVKELVRPGGYFIFLDVYAKKHAESGGEAESSGFNKREVIDIALRNDFVNVLTINRFRRFGRAHTNYLVERMPMQFIETIEKWVPGKPGNFIMLFRKKP